VQSATKDHNLNTNKISSLQPFSPIYFHQLSEQNSKQGQFEELKFIFSRAKMKRKKNVLVSYEIVEGYFQVEMYGGAERRGKKSRL
jgi:hypothetical protein